MTLVWQYYVCLKRFVYAIAGDGRRKQPKEEEEGRTQRVLSVSCQFWDTIHAYERWTTRLSTHVEGNLMCKCNLTVSPIITPTLNVAALSLAVSITLLRNPSFHICSSEHWSRWASLVLGCYAHSEMEVYSPYIPDASTIHTWPYHPLWGKTNKNGHRVFTGVIPHINPLLCPIFALALFLLFRFLVHGEKFPEFNDVKSFFHRVLLCKTSNAAEV